MVGKLSPTEIENYQFLIGYSREYPFMLSTMTNIAIKSGRFNLDNALSAVELCVRLGSKEHLVDRSFINKIMYAGERTVDNGYCKSAAPYIYYATRMASNNANFDEVRAVSLTRDAVTTSLRLSEDPEIVGAIKAITKQRTDINSDDLRISDVVKILKQKAGVSK